MPNKEKETQRSKKKPRSPAYPSIPLEEAIERARQIYEHEQKNKAHVSTIFSHWEYAAKSGRARLALASLKYYGLIEIEGSGDNRKVQLTDLALDILLDEREDSKEREEAIKRAALSPAINSELWKEYEGNLPSEKELEFSLKRERGFTERGVREFLAHFSKTLEHANLELSLDVPKAGEDISDKQEKVQVKTEQQIEQVGAMHDIQLPLASNSWATLSARFPLTQKEWDRMVEVLKAMKPALVKNDEVEDSEGDTEDK